MSQGQYQPPRKTSSAHGNTSSSLRHIYTEDGDVKNRAQTAGRTGAAARSANTTRTGTASSVRPSYKATASVEVKTNPARKAAAPKKSKKTAKPKGKIERFLEKLPYAAGIALCVVMLLAAVVVGNARALSAATSHAMEEWTVSDYIDGRVGEASNLLTLCNRNGVSAEIIEALSDAKDDLKKADSDAVALVISLNQSLETAASNAAAALMSSDLSKVDEQSLSSTMDDFREQGNFLRQQARSYNEDAREALELYEKLPAKFLLPKPQLANMD